MRLDLLFTVIVCVAIFPPTLWGQAQAEAPRKILEDFENGRDGWSYVDGREFPGAKGSLALDTTVAHGGKASLKLEADFTAGGAYVGTYRDLDRLKDEDFKAIHLWIKANHVTRMGVRIVDSTDQCHQKDGGVALAATADWQEVVLKIADLVGGEHWGGANDGRWHGPAKGLGINIGKDAATARTGTSSIQLDDIEVVPGPVMDGHPTLHSVVPDRPSCRPGFEVAVGYRWDAEPLGSDHRVFVHLLNAGGKMVFQSDHAPAESTSIWSGRVEYKNRIYVPIDGPEGEYLIVAGLYRGGRRVVLKAGDGVTAFRDDPTAFQVGVLKVDSRAPIPRLTGPKLNLDGYVMTFDDEFRDLSISAAGPGTRWFTATKENFGDARFMPQKDGFPFSIVKGVLPDKPVLRIEAAKKDGHWCSGIMASADPKGGGFSQKFGYFEMRAKFPASPGMWPAFWLLGQPSLADRSRTNPEIDVVEWYGALPNLVMSTMHLWRPNGKHTAVGDHISVPGLTEGFHRYGVLIDEDNVSYYFDGIQTQQQKTPEEAKVPLYMLVNLAMGSGWPIDKAVSPSYLYVDYVRAYAKK
ncbi:MAG TPA: glycoside hydrolase family 16 protein [Phycisphaerae bacterium]|nr:glycoside hydrolase family 16 protein [Phycisphaerae bacterium]HRY68008.1 glycoside hydrolase family 16 protein [Phycisphaerae bacterium]HSA26745.1 glycoside hydrolase family 16 protein [Phycisphaerae bacterium]